MARNEGKDRQEPHLIKISCAVAAKDSRRETKVILSREKRRRVGRECQPLAALNDGDQRHGVQLRFKRLFICGFFQKPI